MTGRSLFARLRPFGKNEDGSATLEFVIRFSAIWMLFTISIESGTLSLRHVMLERGLDLAVREVRLGIMPDPTHDKLVQRTCDFAPLLPNCLASVRLEMVAANPRAFVAPAANVPCIDRAASGTLSVNLPAGANNQLMILRVCALFEPMLPFAALGRTLVENGIGNEYALVATSSYVMEPFK